VVDPRTGYWAKTEDEDQETDAPPDIVKPVRVVPIVRDRKNALLLRFHNPETYDPTTITTVQHALMRGLEVVFQLEEGEVLGEPLPQRDDRRAILAYEATEGGAGVLNRMVEDPEALNGVARKALELMHFEHVAEAIAAGDPNLLRDREDEACVRGCYRCLLSYYNQPDHERIDRTSESVKALLIDLARGSVVPTARPSTPADAQDWTGLFDQAGMPAPDAEGVTMAGRSLPFAWRAHCVAAAVGAISAAALEAADAKGWMLFELHPGADLPADLIKTFKE